MKATIAIIAAALALVGNVSYLKNTIRGRIKPHPYSWFLWTIVSLVTFLGALEKGAGVGAIPTGTSEGFTLLVFLVSLWHVIRGRDIEAINKRVDTGFLVVALLGLIPWAITRDPTISVITVVTIDLLAFVPTLRKTWAHPETEKPLLYGTNASRHALTLVALESYNIATMLHSIAMIVVNTLMVIFMRRRAAVPE